MKKGVLKQMDKLQFKILDCRKGKNGPEMDIEISKDVCEDTCYRDY